MNAVLRRRSALRLCAALALLSHVGCGSCGGTTNPPGDGAADSGGGPDAACIATTELCNDADDDCDGMADEIYPLCEACCDSPDDDDACMDDAVVCASLTTFSCSEVGGTIPELCNGVDDDCDLDVDEDFTCTACCDSPDDANTCDDDAMVCDTTTTAVCADDPAPTIVVGTNPPCPACSTGFGDRLWDAGTLVLGCGAEGPSTDHCTVDGGWGALPPFAPGDYYCCISGCNDCVMYATTSIQALVDTDSWGWTEAECL